MTTHRIQLPRVLKSVSLGDAERPLPAPKVLKPAKAAIDEAARKARDEAAALAAEQAAVARLADGFAMIDEQLAEIERRRQQSLAEMRQAAIELAIAIASRIVHETIEADEMAIETMVADMLASVGREQPAVVRLHPQDLKLLKKRQGSEQSGWLDTATIQLIGDAALQRGECRVDAGDFGVLSQIELQLNEIRQHLLETLDHAQVERRRPQPGDRTLRRFPDRRETA